MTFTFKHLPMSKLDELKNEPVNKFFTQIIADWAIEEPYNEDNLKLLFDNYPSAAVAITTTYYNELLGNREKKLISVAEAMYGGMTKQEAENFERAFGFPPDIDDVEVVPDVWESYLVFSAMSTQWRVGMNGATGLDYSVIPNVLELLNIKNKATIFDDLRVMELKALELINE
ncbi:Uncharacterised protein [Providencia alcalifaciens]|nr:Uncharacterised protein [Providencia alcalifaciens]